MYLWFSVSFGLPAIIIAEFAAMMVPLLIKLGYIIVLGWFLRKLADIRPPFIRVQLGEVRTS